MALCTAVEEGSEEHRFQVVQTGPRSLSVRLEPASRGREAPARVREALAGFLARQGLARISLRVETGPIAAHPVSGKFRQVWREKPRHAARRR
jgi:hypothetical protein